MFELWIPITIAAAFFQNLRSALQKHLKGRLSTNGAAYARFIYAVPIAGIYMWLLHTWGAYEYPQPNRRFLLFCALGGLCQILFTVFLLWMFSFKSFAVGTTYSKLEVVMVALFGAILLGDHLSGLAVLAIAISASGLIALSIGREKLAFTSLISGLKHRSTAIGLLCAMWLGGSVVFFRGASLSLDSDQFVMAAAYTLFVSLVLQCVLMGVYIVFKEPGEIARVIRNWRWAGAVGLSGALASIAWFSAFTLQNAGYVRALGQVELIFTFVATTLFFKEKVRFMEAVGTGLVAAGIVVLLFVS